MKKRILLGSMLALVIMLLVACTGEEGIKNIRPVSVEVSTIGDGSIELAQQERIIYMRLARR